MIQPPKRNPLENEFFRVVLIWEEPFKLNVHDMVTKINMGLLAT